jgi:hypothetical protein
MMSRERPWPAADATLVESLLGFLQFVHTTVVNKVAGLDEQQARATPLPTSPVMNPLGLIKHLAAARVGSPPWTSRHRSRADRRQSRRVGQRLDHPVTDNPALA